MGRWLASAMVLLLFPLFTARGDDLRPAGVPLHVGQIDVQIIGDHPDGFDWAGFVRALINLHLTQGAAFSPDRVASAKQSLIPFGHVALSRKSAAEAVDLVFTFTPYSRIINIVVRGNYPVFERDVRSVLDMAAGDIFRPQDMPGEEKRVADLYKSRGFVDPKVRITWKTDEDGHKRVYVTIDEGPYYRLSEVKFAGNHFMADVVIQSHLATWRRAVIGVGVARFEPQMLKKDVDKLTAFYRKHGFYDAEIKPDTTLDATQDLARVAITIKEGPAYNLIFEGNHFFSDANLTKQLMMNEIGNQGNRGLRRSVQAVKKHYLEAGFADVRVRWHDEAEARSNATAGSPEGLKRHVVITVQEGVRRIVEQVEIKGNRALDTEQIKGQILTRPKHLFHSGVYVAKTLEDDLAAVRALYLKFGYLSPKIDDEIHRVGEAGFGKNGSSQEQIKVVITIAEGIQTLVGQVSITGEAPVDRDRLRAAVTLKTGDPYQPYMLREEENHLTALISPLGYPYVQAKAEAQISEDRTRANLKITIDSGAKVEVGEIFFAGNFLTKTGLLQRELALSQGQNFDLKAVLQGQRNIRDLNLFTSVRFNSIGLKEEAATVPLLITVAEQKPYFFEIGGGYQNDKGFYIRSKAGDKNLLGTGKDIWLGTEISQAGYRWDAGFGEPKILGSRYSLDSSIYIERSEPFNQDFGTDTMGGTSVLSRKWARYFSVSLGLKFERRQQFARDYNAPVPDPSIYDPRTALIASPSLNFDNRDSFIRPTKGLLSYFSVDISKGLDNEVDDFVKYRFDLRWFYPFSQRLVLATRIGAGYLQPYGDTDQLPTDQFFYLGGTTTVRGFEENLLRYDTNNIAVGGRLIMLGSVEGRIKLFDNWELATFVDTGRVALAAEDVGDDGFRWSTGLGVEYVTPVGPIGLFYGLKLDRRPGERPGWWHFSIGYTF